MGSTIDTIGDTMNKKLAELLERLFNAAYGDPRKEWVEYHDDTIELSFEGMILGHTLIPMHGDEYSDHELYLLMMALMTEVFSNTSALAKDVSEFILVWEKTIASP